MVLLYHISTVAVLIKLSTGQFNDAATSNTSLTPPTPEILPDNNLLLDTCAFTIPDPPTSGDLALGNTPNDDWVRHEKRAGPKEVSSINSCTWTTPLGDQVTIPGYTGGFQFWDLEVSTRLPSELSTVPRYFKTTSVACLPQVTKLAFNEFTPPSWSQDSNEVMTTDHVYELAILKQFLSNIIDSTAVDSLTCAEANHIFFGASPGQYRNELKKVYDNLPGYNHADFAVMSGWLNSLGKGSFMGIEYNLPNVYSQSQAIPSTGFFKTSASKIDAKLGRLKAAVLGVETMQQRGTVDALILTNKRIYKTFDDLDQFMLATPGIPRRTFGFAPRYVTYMNGLANRWNNVYADINHVMNAIGQDLVAVAYNRNVNATKLNEMQSALNLYTAAYQHFPSPLTLSIAFDWDLTTPIRDLVMTRESGIQPAHLPKLLAPQTLSTSRSSETIALSQTTAAPNRV